MKIGCDPEFFLWNGQHVVSAIGKLGGTKKEPKRITHGWVQEDNVAGEVNIVPASDAELFSKRIENVLLDVTKMVESMKLSICGLASAVFPESELQDPKAQAAGCDPDFDAWEMDQNIPPYLKGTNLRSAGGHIQISWNGFDGYQPVGSHDENPFKPQNPTQSPMEGIHLVRMLDLVLGVPSVIYDRDVERKKLYGKAGCFRPTPFGIEYRTMSNWWIFDEADRKYVFQQAKKAVNLYQEFKTRLQPSSIPTGLGNRVRNCINKQDQKEAETLIRLFS